MGFIACEDAPSRVDPDLGLDFFPLEIGDFRVYDVQSIAIGKDTTNYQLKESVVDTFTTGLGETAYVLHRFSRAKDSLPWRLDSAWTARLDGRYAVVVENNIPIAKIHFPVEEGLTWDGNSFNSGSEAIYEITGVDQSFQVGAEIFPRTLKINEKNVFDTLIVKDIQQAVYAREVGLVYKRKERIDFCRFVECLGEVDSWTVFEQKLMDFGKE